jgi:AcrR family transcriptional regulator
VADEQRERVLEAVIAVAADVGLARISMADVARRAGLSRATLYRHFPGGKDEVLLAAVEWESLKFLRRLRAAVEGSPDLETILTRGLRFARHAIDDHELLQRFLATEPERFLPLFAGVDDAIHAAITGFFLPEVLALEPTLDPSWAADHLARLLVSYIGTAGLWNVDDDAELRQLVRAQFLAGLGPRLAPRP